MQLHIINCLRIFLVYKDVPKGPCKCLDDKKVGEIFKSQTAHLVKKFRIDACGALRRASPYLLKISHKGNLTVR